jgi:PAS domain S-box-containing protein
MSDRTYSERKTLRQRAEAVVRGEIADIAARTPEEIRGIIHELQVYRVELEMQNEELRRAQQELEISRDRFFWLFNQAPIGYLTLDGVGMIHQVNQTLADMLRVDISELQNKSFSSWIAPAHRDAFLSRFKSFFKRPESKRIEVSLLRSNGSTLHARLEGRLMKSPLPLAREKDGQPLLLLTVSDVTERRKAQEALAASEELLKLILESTAEGILCADKSGRVIHRNRRFDEMWRVGPEYSDTTDVESLLLHLAEQLEDSEEFLDSVRTLYQSKEQRLDVLKFKDGRVFERYSCPLADHVQVSGRLWSFRDVTEMRKLENQYLQAQRMEAVGQLAGGVAHDFNNLLQVITGYVDLALAGLTEDDALRSRLERVRGAASRATTLVRQLLTFSRRQSMVMERIHVNSVIVNVMGMLRRVLGEHITVDFRPGENVSAILGDAGQIELVLMNLAVNARDAMPDGGRITIETRELEADQTFRREHPWALAQNYVQLRFSDTGEGVPPELQERIFEPFFTTKDIGKGTGLGLATVYGIMRQHDGAIDLERHDGGGAVFNVYFPAMRSADGQAGKAAATGCSESDNHGGGGPGSGMILIAEDDASVREMAVQILESAGYRTLAARDGVEAQEMFLQHRENVDLAFLDVVMPRASGRAVSEYIRSINPRVPVLFCTGYDFNILNSTSANGGPFHVIRKPFDQEHLLRSVRDILAHD